MPKRTDIKRILVIGSGPIVIGQAAEFDYAGTQACLALKEEGYEVVLCNSNPATIMTDNSIADKVYMEPLTLEYIAKIIRYERPDAILPSIGGQTGLNLAMQLEQKGILRECRTELLGTKSTSIAQAEDRELFKQLCESLSEPVLPSDIANSIEEGLEIAAKIGYPVVLRPAFTLGGTGGGFANNKTECYEIMKNALVLSPVHQVLVEKSIKGFKEIEYEVILYICSPNNPTGAVFNRLQLQAWIDFANENGAVILFDAAYEIFVEDKDLPHSVYELDGADRCAIEICSLSKTAGFTGTRLGYTVVPSNLVRNGISLNAMWSRNRETRTNGISYILQKGAAAVFAPEGQAQIHENLWVYKKNAAYFMEAPDKAGIWYCGGKNSPYIWMKCPEGMSGWEFFDCLLSEIQVVGILGDGFGECGKGYFRFSTFGDPEETKEAANRLCALLKKE